MSAVRCGNGSAPAPPAPVGVRHSPFSPGFWVGQGRAAGEDTPMGTASHRAAGKLCLTRWFTVTRWRDQFSPGFGVLIATVVQNK